jgi:hypothetical protein
MTRSLGSWVYLGFCLIFLVKNQASDEFEWKHLGKKLSFWSFVLSKVHPEKKKKNPDLRELRTCTRNNERENFNWEKHLSLVCEWWGKGQMGLLHPETCVDMPGRRLSLM